MDQELKKLLDLKTLRDTYIAAKMQYQEIINEYYLQLESGQANAYIEKEAREANLSIPEYNRLINDLDLEIDTLNRQINVDIEPIAHQAIEDHQIPNLQSQPAAATPNNLHPERNRSFFSSAQALLESVFHYNASNHPRK